MSASSSSAPRPASLVVDVHDLPPEGREISGELDSSLFQLEQGGPQAASPLRYHLRIFRDGDNALLSGSINADFTFECVLCLERYTDRVLLAEYSAEIPINGKTPTVDLTDVLREDILLALPGHPHCSDGTLHPRCCPAAELFPPSSEYSEDHPEEPHTSGGPPDVWGALDQLHLDSPAASSQAASKSRRKPTT